MARTIGKQNIHKAQMLTRQLLGRGERDIVTIEDKVIAILGPLVMNIWESSHDEVRRVVGDIVMEQVHVTERRM